MTTDYGWRISMCDFDEFFETLTNMFYAFFRHHYNVRPWTEYFNPLSANPTKWSNTLKQFFGNLPANGLSVFDHFVILALKELSTEKHFADEWMYYQTIFAANYSSIV